MAHVCAFFTELLVHTKGDYVRRPFKPAPWQRREILAPLFGEVEWDAKRRKYVRRYRQLYLFMARKNGKSELLAGISLYLLAADGEQGAEVYGLALDADQAAIVYQIAARMVELKPELKQYVEVIRSTGRLVMHSTGSTLAVLPGDAPGALGLNPHGVYLDELLTQPSRDLYDAIWTGFGARAQPLLMMATTAESDPNGFAASEREWSKLVLADPSLDPRRLVVMYDAPEDADWTNPSTWKMANPALGDYLDRRVLADECRKALHHPSEERAFRQFRLNQPTNAIGRALNLADWDETAGLVDEVSLRGRRCHGGLDLASTSDLTALCWDFPEPDGTHQAIWRLWLPSAALPALDRRTGGRASLWARDGFLEIVDGAVVDYEVVRRRILSDAERFEVVDLGFDRWGALQLVQQLADDGLLVVATGQGFSSMSPPTKELLRLVASGRYRHGGNPALRWQASNLVTRKDAADNEKPDKAKSSEKIDGIVAAIMALDRAMRAVPVRRGAATFV